MNFLKRRSIRRRVKDHIGGFGPNLQPIMAGVVDAAFEQFTSDNNPTKFAWVAEWFVRESDRFAIPPEAMKQLFSDEVDRLIEDWTQTGDNDADQT